MVKVFYFIPTTLFLVTPSESVNLTKTCGVLQWATGLLTLPDLNQLYRCSQFGVLLVPDGAVCAM